MKLLFSKYLSKLGYEIRSIPKREDISFQSDFSRNIGYEFENEANEAIKIVRKQTMLPYINLITLYEQALFCEKRNIEGDFVECGVWKGGAVGLMALANLNNGINRRKLHLFDAFEEICAPNEEFDGDNAIKEVKQILGRNALVKGELTPLRGFYNKLGGPGNINDCKRLIEDKIGYPLNCIHYHKGWFQNTIQEKSREIDKIAILRLDGDWYESTKICLDYLFDKVVSGGFVIIDDYGLYSGCKKAVDEFFDLRHETYYLNYSSWACRYIIKV